MNGKYLLDTNAIINILKTEDDICNFSGKEFFQRRRMETGKYNTDKIKEIISQGENRRVDFKSGSVRADSLAVEMSAFANTSGGIILVGVEDIPILKIFRLSCFRNFRTPK